MENMFEKTMLTCLESRNTKKQSKLSESYKKVKKLTESDEANLSYEDDLPEENDPEVMDDIQDDVLVVVDPELDTDEIEGAAADAQEIIDGTPEGEVPSTDEYIGDMAYTCPICGNTFFSEVEMKGGDQCPVCGDAPSGYVLAGTVTETDDTEDEPLDPVDNEPVIKGDEVEEIESEEMEVKEPEEDLNVKGESKKVVRRIPMNNRRFENRTKKVAPRFQIDESTFNPYMTKFVRENYKNARSFRITGATLNKNRILTLECVVTFKSGNSKKVNLKTEGFRAFNGKRAYIDFKESGAFKTESRAKTAPFIFTTSMRNNVLKCEGMRYNFISRISESKKAHVYGKVVTESMRPVSKRTVRR